MKKNKNERQAQLETINIFDKHLSGILHCPDRIIFKGYLYFRFADAVKGLLYKHNVLFKNYAKWMQVLTKKIVDHAKITASKKGRQYIPLNGKQRKEEMVKKIIKEENIKSGLVCIISAVEACSTFKTIYGDGKPDIIARRGKCLCIYYYYLHKEYGLIYVRIQTWLPFMVQVYMNGHSILEHLFKKNRIRYKKEDNAFTYISNFDKANELAESIKKIKWMDVLEDLAFEVNPLLSSIFKGEKHYWVFDQFEYSSDLIFSDTSHFADVKEQVFKACNVMSVDNIFSFYGRKRYGQYKGDVGGSYKGTDTHKRFRFRMKTNFLKIYDKTDNVLRIESVINQPREFKGAYREKHGSKMTTVYKPLKKSVTSVYKLTKVGKDMNKRLLKALSKIKTEKKELVRFQSMTESLKVNNKSYKGFNPLSKEEQAIFKACIDGDHLVNGFRNKNIRTLLYPNLKQEEIKRCSAKISRLLKRLSMFGLISRRPRSFKYKVSEKGLQFLSASLSLVNNYDLLKLAA